MLQGLFWWCPLFVALPSAEPCISRMADVRVATRAGHVLAGLLTLPKSARHTTVLFIGGAGESERDYSTNERNLAYPMLSDSLACAGIASFRFDEVGVGLSTGSYWKYATTRTLSNDVRDIVDMLARLPDTRGDRLVLVGHSEGGAIASIVAGESRNIAGVVLLAAPVMRGDAIIEYQSATLLRDGETPESLADRERRRLAKGPWHRYFLDYDPSPSYAMLKQPVLILQGTTDWLVTPQQADSISRLIRSNGNSNSACVKFSGLSHGFGRETPPKLLDQRVFTEVVDWIRSLSSPRFRSQATNSCASR